MANDAMGNTSHVDRANSRVASSARKVRAPAYTLTHSLLAEYGGAVLCMDERAIGKHHRLHAVRPDASLNVPIFRNDVIEIDGTVRTVSDLNEQREPPALIRVDIRGPIEQRAGYHDQCGGWSDGHDAIAERLSNALETSDVLLVIDSPGGAHAGLQEAVKQVLKEKELHGRRVTVYADEMIGSAAYWWAAVVGDEIFGPESAQIGSIGARAGHQSVAGALEREGIATTYFVWPGPGKVAFAPELPLSELGAQRGNRDTAAAGEAFAKAIGPRRGLTRDEIVDLDADVLTGFSAVKARLADGVASLDEVMNYALALASRGDTMQVRAEGQDDPKSPDEVRAEEPQKPGHPEPDGDEPEGEDEGDEPDGDEPPVPAAKYCAQCGNKLKAEAEEEPETGDPDAEDSAEEDDDTKAKMRNQPPPERERQSASAIAGLFGLRADSSLPAVKSAAIAYANLGKAVMSATGDKSPDAARGALKALIDDASEVMKLRADLKSLRSKVNSKERTELLTKLTAADPDRYPRGDLFIDREENGKIITTPSPVYAEMKLATLRGLVESKTAGAPAKRSSNPFEPSKTAADGAKRTARVATVTEGKPGFIRNIAARSTASAQELAQSTAALEEAGLI